LRKGELEFQNAQNTENAISFFADDGQPVAETVSDDIVLGAVGALCDFSLLVSLQNYSNLSLTAQHDAKKQCHMKNSTFQA